MSRYAVLICSCDAYSDIWEVFFDLLSKYWGDTTTKFYLSTESVDFENKSKYPLKIDVIKKKKNGNWGGRIREALDQIKEEYVFLLLDDFFCKNEVDNGRLDKLVDMMENDQSIASFKLMYSAVKLQNPSIYDNGSIQLKKNSWGKTTFFPALWRKTILKKWLRRNETAWGFEQCGSRRAYRWKYPEVVYEIETPCIYDYLWLKPWCSAILNGKWVQSDELIDFFNGECIAIKFEDRGFITYEEYAKRDLKYVLKNKSIGEIIVRGFWRIIYYF